MKHSEKTRKNSEQSVINAIVETVMDKVNHERKTLSCKRLRTCSAYVYETEHFYLLRSYNTIVACVEKSTGDCFDFLRWAYGYTSTSSQHIAKFSHDYGNGKVFCWYPV